jgi:hypothetical protein
MNSIFFFFDGINCYFQKTSSLHSSCAPTAYADSVIVDDRYTLSAHTCDLLINSFGFSPNFSESQYVATHRYKTTQFVVFVIQYFLFPFVSSLPWPTLSTHALLSFNYSSLKSMVPASLICSFRHRPSMLQVRSRVKHSFEFISVHLSLQVKTSRHRTANTRVSNTKWTPNGPKLIPNV